MLKAGVLKPIQEATPWINSFVLVEGTDQQGKPKLRICLDPTNLNKAIIREPYHFKTPEAEFGRYHYTVMPFGTTIAGNVFQRKLNQRFGHLQNVIVIADDIMVVGKQPNHKDHDLALTKLINTARECNVCLNYDKLQYKQNEVDFFGQTYTVDGQKPAQSKIKAVQEMPPPTM